MKSSEGQNLNYEIYKFVGVEVGYYPSAIQVVLRHRLRRYRTEQATKGDFSMTGNKLLVQRHRAKMAEEGCARMEVTLSRRFIKQAREFARQRGMPFWYFVEHALVAYAPSTGNAAQTGDLPKSQQ